MPNSTPKTSVSFASALWHRMREYYLVTTVGAAIIVGLSLQFTSYSVLSRWLLEAFSIIVALKLAWGMVQDLREGRWGIDILAVMAIVSTVAVGEYWASIVIVLMLTGGEALEDYANHRATRDLSALLMRAPQLAHRQDPSGSVTDIAVIEVAVADTLLVKPGEVVPVDGTLLDAIASFDESSLTGESLPVEHKKGESVLSGSVNGDQAVHITALHTAADSQYQKIIELVKAASDSQAPFVRLADRYAVPFTLISLGIAGIAWALNGNPLRFAEVLVVATPCPLLLGAPIAFISGMSRAAKHGIIIKNGATLEKLARIKTVAFDKTGTLTYGEPQVTQVIPAAGFESAEVLRLAASAERQSGHVLAHALQVAATEQQLELTSASAVTETTAQGIEATIDGQRLLVGKWNFLKEHDVTGEPAHSASGETAVYVARGQQYLGSIVFADRVRDNAGSTLDRLHALGINHSLMLTGDGAATAKRIGQELGLEHIHAECLPQDKVAAITHVQERPVMMVGDGVNDAPVLAAADVGLAMGARGSTAASETADVVVLLDDISRTAVAIFIGKATMRIALQSIWIGIAISIGLMIVAATGVIPAVIGAALQEVVDVVVIFNALRAHGSYRR